MPCEVEHNDEAKVEAFFKATIRSKVESADDVTSKKGIPTIFTDCFIIFLYITLAALHYLIHHPSVNYYYTIWKNTIDEPHILPCFPEYTASFRGRPLNGTKLQVPDGYKGECIELHCLFFFQNFHVWPRLYLN